MGRFEPCQQKGKIFKGFRLKVHVLKFTAEKYSEKLSRLAYWIQIIRKNSLEAYKKFCRALNLTSSEDF